MTKDLKTSLAWGGGIILLALGMSLARGQGYVDQEAILRTVLGATGLMIAWFGNRIPKKFAPGVGVRKAQRVTAWSMVISGLVYAGAFILAPTMNMALIIGGGAVVFGLAVSMGYCLSLRQKATAA